MIIIKDDDNKVFLIFWKVFNISSRCFQDFSNCLNVLIVCFFDFLLFSFTEKILGKGI